MRAHVADGCGLTGGSGRGSRCGRLYFAGGAAIDKSSANFHARAQLAASERPGPSDCSARAAISGAFGLEQPQNPLSAVGGPCSNEAPVELGERLR